MAIRQDFLPFPVRLHQCGLGRQWPGQHSHGPGQTGVGYRDKSLFSETVISHSQVFKTYPPHMVLHDCASGRSEWEITRLRTVQDYFD